jgi:hypothetical protein
LGVWFFKGLIIIMYLCSSISQVSNVTIVAIISDAHVSSLFAEKEQKLKNIKLIASSSAHVSYKMIAKKS